MSNDGDGPLVLRFEALLVKHPKVDSVTLLDVPVDVSKKLHGMTKVEGTISGHPFRAALEPNALGGYSLRVSKAMSNGANADVGDTVKLAILGPEHEIVPADLEAPLANSHEAKALWKNLTPLGRLDWIRWINSTKNPETRARRITRTVDQLSEGKRRACCVNVNEYMLCHIEKDELKAMNRNK
jgi:hypothetical protein